MRCLWPAALLVSWLGVAWGKSLAATSESERRDSYLVAREIILKVTLLNLEGMIWVLMSILLIWKSWDYLLV